MTRTHALRMLRRHLTAARFAERSDIPTGEAIEVLQDMARVEQQRRLSRRDLLGAAGKAAAAAAFASTLAPWRLAHAARKQSTSLSVGVVGAGLAGLTAARELRNAGVEVALYDAATRVGGRVWTLRNHFPGQVAERGGELIDNLHKTMLAYAQEFDLELEDVNKVDGEVFYRFGDQDYSEAEIVDEYRAFVSTMQADLRALSGEVSAAAFTDADRRIDLTSIDDYLAGDNADGTPAGALLSAVIRVAYCIEYGLETYDQSAINFLHFIHADKRSEFKPWGVFSDERWHIAGGNDQIAARIAEELDPVIELGMRLARVARASDGRVVLTFSDGARTVERTHDRVILAIPFSVLRSVELDPSLDLPAWKTDAINQFVVGASAKHMIGFGGRPWADLGGNGASYSDQVDLQCTWETNVSASSATRAVLTDFSGGDRAATLNPANAQTEARRFLDALEQVFPGSKAKASVSRGQYLTHLEHWPSNPYVLGGYSCYRPGQFTTIAGREGTAVGNVHFAGEHTDSFYSWQGFMEGACLSGLRTAAEVLDA